MGGGGGGLEDEANLKTLRVEKREFCCLEDVEGVVLGAAIAEQEGLLVVVGDGRSHFEPALCACQ